MEWYFKVSIKMHSFYSNDKLKVLFIFPIHVPSFSPKRKINKPKFRTKSCFPNHPKCRKVISTLLYIIISLKSSIFHRWLMKTHSYSNLMHILLLIHITHNSQAALFCDFLNSQLALSATQNIPIWGVPDPFPMRQTIADMITRPTAEILPNFW